ncbi:MAG TPA: serine/threonine protein phosphatase [Cyanobacteria bacterium UBA11372]|nr:serine/threonine protein phosphatase [Cyanobacteria bacterium UBA11372]
MSEINPRNIVIGDVHGHYKGLMTLLEEISPDSEDRIYFLGDLIDRGPHSSQVVKFVQESSYKCLLGNHEQMLLDSFVNGKVQPSVLQAWLYSGGHTTLESYPKGRIPLEDLDWMQTLPTHLDLGDVWLVHAGVHPEIPLEEQTADQFCWIRQEFHSMSQPFFADKLIVTGHTITFTLPGIKPGKIAAGSGWIDIDTGAYHRRSGWLTGLDITNSMVYQVNVFDNYVRTLPLEEILMPIQPAVRLPRLSKG